LFGGRYEIQSIHLGEVDDDLPAYPGYAARTGQKNTDHGLSVSAGAVYYPAKDYSLGLSLAYSQRLPAAVELFSNGPHGGTGSYEIGTTGLDHENSLGLDLTLRKRAGFVTGSAGVFVHQIDNFIFEQRDERRYFDDASGDLLNYPVPAGDEYLPIYQFVARDALFYGAEAEVQFHLIDAPGQRLHLSLLGDLVRAEQTTDDQALPRIPPARLGLGLGYEHGRWSLGTEVRHSFKQTRFAPEETETDAYTLVGVHALYRFADRGPGHPGLEVFARGDNLTDADARLATSFLKAIAPLPGRSFTVGARLSF
jgi:iron complex outermembrane receptor protein